MMLLVAEVPEGKETLRQFAANHRRVTAGFSR
jgi:hypothetical protein